MKNYILALLLIFQNSEQVFSQNQTDSLLHAALSLPDDTLKIRQLFNISAKLGNNNLAKQQPVLHQVYALAKRLGAPDWLPKIEFRLGANYANSGSLDSALIFMQLSAQGYEKQANLKELAKVYTNLPYVFKRLGQYEKANEAIFKAVAIYEKLGDQKGLGRAYSKLGSLLFAQSKFEDAAKYTQNAYETSLVAKDSVLMGYCLQLLGDIEYKLSHYEKALHFQTEGLALRKKMRDSVEIANSLGSLGSILQEMKRYPEALKNFQEAVRISRNIGYKEDIFLHNLGTAYAATGDFKNAVAYFQASKRAGAGSGNRFSESQTDLRLAAAFAGLGKFDSAYFFKNRGQAVSDSILNADNLLRMSELQTKYETAQKETKIAQQTEQLASERRQFWAVVVGLVLALAAGFLLFLLSQKLRQRNREKEFLIKEIHHRVKNNLQVLSSLLHLQSRNIHDEAALDAVREGQNRVDAMGLIHQKLYMGENLAAVEMQDYLQNLGDTLLDSFGLGGRIKIKYSLSPMHLDVDTAIPLGLIINELLTNSLKYAFPDGRAGEVEIKLWTDENRKLCLQISDDGAGKSAPTDAKNSTGFGSKLVQILSQKLKGKPEIFQSENGYSTFVRFENFKMA